MRRVLFCLLVLACVSMGCEATNVTPPSKVCADDDTCSKGEICEKGTCVTGCRSAYDCPTTLPFCYKGTCSDTLCRPGEEQACYDGEQGTSGVGACKGGTQVCLASGKAWSVCANQQLPSLEICDKIDNNCDGKVDNDINCSCEPGEQRACYTGPAGLLNVGTCRAGIQHCNKNDRVWGPCLEQVLPSKELCDGLDNDCNGKVDDPDTCRCQAGETRKCYRGPEANRGIGLCKEGSQTCVQGVWSACEGSVLPKEEDTTCNQDANCDGKTFSCDKAWLAAIASGDGTDRINSLVVDDQGDVWAYGNIDRNPFVYKDQGSDPAKDITGDTNDGNRLFLGRWSKEGKLKWAWAFGKRGIFSGRLALGGPNQSWGAIVGCGDGYGAPAFNGPTGTLSTTRHYTDADGGLSLPYLAVFDTSKMSASGLGFVFSASIQGNKVPSDTSATSMCLDDVTIDKHGHIYVVGSFHGTEIKFGNAPALHLKLDGHDEAKQATFVAKLERGTDSWKWSWVKLFSSKGNALATNVAIGPDDTVYVAGVFREELSCLKASVESGDATMLAPCSQDTPLLTADPSIKPSTNEIFPETVFLLKLDAKGALQSKLSGGELGPRTVPYTLSERYNLIRNLSVDEQGSALLTGAVWGSYAFGPKLRNTALQLSDKGVYVVKAGNKGKEWSWMAHWRTQGNALISAVSTEKGGRVFLSGSYSGLLQSNLSNGHSFADPGGTEVFVVELKDDTTQATFVASDVMTGSGTETVTSMAFHAGALVWGGFFSLPLDAISANLLVSAKRKDAPSLSLSPAKLAAQAGFLAQLPWP